MRWELIGKVGLHVCMTHALYIGNLEFSFSVSRDSAGSTIINRNKLGIIVFGPNMNSNYSNENLAK